MPVVGGLLSVRCKSPYTVWLGTPKLLAGFLNSAASRFKIRNYLWVKMSSSHHKKDAIHPDVLDLAFPCLVGHRFIDD